tara:strand:+ start:2773 stop:3918 length:1146 start_codon:yes stop_codon:yes gene_type:complete
MKILVIEDDAAKREEIQQFIVSLGVPADNVAAAGDMAEFMAKYDAEVAICVIDLRLPAYDGAGPERNGLGVLQAIEQAGGSTKLLAISAYPGEFDDIRNQFERRGCMLVDFEQKTVWQNILRQMVIEGQRQEHVDFLIFCALRAERAPYTGMIDLVGDMIFKENLTRLNMSIGGRRGIVIELPRMGLVDAAATAGHCIEKFKPKLVAMSGICAGFPGRAELGQLLVSELAYEYQSGKWTADGFSQEPYQVPISEAMRVLTREMLEDGELLTRLEHGFKLTRPAQLSEPKSASFTSGSAVIASEDHIKQVAIHHRRVAGLDMEIYAIHRAAHVAACRPEVLCAKTVVDLAGGDKDDRLHPYGSMISARFVVEGVQKYFEHHG